MKITYVEKNLRGGSMELVEHANSIIEEYAKQGFDLTLRQLYYQFVSRNLLANTEKNYKRLGCVIADARLAGLIDWDAITDRTRYVRDLSHWDSPQSIVETCSQQFRYAKWEDQPYYVEVWIEKDALIGVIEGVCQELDVPFLACRGYASASEVWGAGHRRFRPRRRAGKNCLVLYLGDHDPSGIDMSRDVRDRLEMFCGGPVEVNRLALNADQVEQYNPPENPTKMTDSRAEDYVARFGEHCWELDALEPAVIAALIRVAVNDIRDDDLWEEAVEREQEARRKLGLVSERWEKLTAKL